MMGRWLSQLAASGPSSGLGQNVQNGQNDRGVGGFVHSVQFVQGQMQQNAAEPSPAAPVTAPADEFPRDLTLPILLGMVAHLCCRRRFDDRRQRWLIEYDLSTDPPLIRLARALATVAPDLPALTLAAENAADLDGLSARLEAVLSTEAGQAAAWALIDQAEQVRR